MPHTMEASGTLDSIKLQGQILLSCSTSCLCLCFSRAGPGACGQCCNWKGQRGTGCWVLCLQWVVWGGERGMRRREAL